jgi:hypothetical protein
MEVPDRLDRRLSLTTETKGVERSSLPFLLPSVDSHLRIRTNCQDLNNLGEFVLQNRASIAATKAHRLF